MNNTAPQARFLMATSAFLMIACMFLVAELIPSAPLVFVAICFFALLHRVIRRIILHRFGLREGATRWVNPDPLGPWLDQRLFGQAATGETIRLDAQGRDVSQLPGLWDETDVEVR